MNLNCNQKSMTLWSHSLPRGPWAPVIKERPYGVRNAIDRALAALVSAEQATIRRMSRHGHQALRIGIGVVYLWFGALKLFPSLSPAEDIVLHTFRLLHAEALVPFLAPAEVAIGLSLVLGVFMRITLPIVFMHMAGTVLPLFLLTHETWTHFPFALTMEGQYIVKNIVIVGAATVLAGSRSLRWRSRAPVSHTLMDAMPPSGNGMRIR